jgi:hypothetical protein
MDLFGAAGRNDGPSFLDVALQHPRGEDHDAFPLGRNCPDHPCLAKDQQSLHLVTGDPFEENGFVLGENLFTTEDAPSGALDQSQLTKVAKEIDQLL